MLEHKVRGPSNFWDLWCPRRVLPWTLAKTEAIHIWLTLSHVKQVQSFIGFANFYRRFIVNFSEKPLLL